MVRAVAALLTGLLVACVTSACTDPEPEPADVVRTSAGDVRGIEEGPILAYRGIPYAAPPTGDLRWRPPQPHGPWEGVRDGSGYAPECFQAAERFSRVPSASSSEDCLYLNVSRPSDGAAGDLPVMVWLHGGGFIEGSGERSSNSSTAFPYNSSALVSRGVVLVTVNYRLGRLGYFAHPALEGDVANFGMLDQIAALEWVSDNIASFGGDPGNVTIFGQSAGGMSVNALMTSPLARDLFHRAIVQSGLGRDRSRTLEEAREQGESLYPDMEADELRELDAEKTLTPQVDLVDGDAPILDEVVPIPVDRAFAQGREAAVPYLVGTNELEMPDAIVATTRNDPDALRASLVGRLADEAESVYGGAERLAARLVTDALFTEPARYLAEQHSAHAPAYLYRFGVEKPPQLYPVHTSELPFVFDQAESLSKAFPGATALADTMADYWVAFARSGDPNRPGAPNWPRAREGAFLLFANDGVTRVKDDPLEPELDFLERAAEQQRED